MILCAFRREPDGPVMDPADVDRVVDRLVRAIKLHYPTVSEVLDRLGIPSNRWDEQKTAERPIHLVRWAVLEPKVFSTFCTFTLAEERDSLLEMMRPVMVKVDEVRAVELLNRQQRKRA